MSELDKTFQETIFNTLTSLLAQNKFDSDTQLDIYLAMKKAAMDLQESQIQKLQEKMSTGSLCMDKQIQVSTPWGLDMPWIFCQVKRLQMLTALMTNHMKMAKSSNLTRLCDVGQR
jgi:hypothetical protein